jgi:putative acetyltransferase
VRPRPAACPHARHGADPTTRPRPTDGNLDRVLIETRTTEDAELLAMVTAQQSELAGLEGDGHISFPLYEQIEYLVGVLDGGRVGVGFGDGEAVACGALQALEPGVGEVKRMYVRPAYRGHGLSRIMLAAVEQLAAQRGFHTLRLETGRVYDAALGLYTSSGYNEIPLFGQYVGHPLSVCFEKRL